MGLGYQLKESYTEEAYNMWIKYVIESSLSIRSYLQDVQNSLFEKCRDSKPTLSDLSNYPQGGAIMCGHYQSL